MEAKVYKKVTAVTELARKLDESKKHLRLSNIFSCIITFREVLEIFLNASDLIQADRTRATEALNEFQHRIQSSHQFRDLYGAVTFRDNDFRTTHEFIGQLVKIKEEEIAGFLQNEEVSKILNLDDLDEEDRQKTLIMISLVERGEQMVLRQLVSENDDLASLVLSYYNDNGINLRMAGELNKAIQEYKKALFVSPDDEHLFYNLARAYIENSNKAKAQESIRLALMLNPEFKEGMKLQKHINQWISESPDNTEDNSQDNLL